MATQILDTDKKIELALKNIRSKCTEYIRNNNIHSLVIGMSGGLDSTLCAAILQPVAQELRNIPLYGMVMPINSNLEDTEMGIEASDMYCSTTLVFEDEEELCPILDNLVYTLSENDPISIGNIKARIRMILLYNQARHEQGLVVSTDNFSELMLGFWTICGDVGDISPIQYIWKGLEEPRLAEIVGVPTRFIEQTPTDGLGITDSDMDQIGVDSYEEVDRRLIKYIDTGKYEKNCPVIERHLRTKFKRNGAYVINRHMLFDK